MAFIHQAHQIAQMLLPSRAHRIGEAGSRLFGQGDILDFDEYLVGEEIINDEPSSYNELLRKFGNSFIDYKCILYLTYKKIKLSGSLWYTERKGKKNLLIISFYDWAKNKNKKITNLPENNFFIYFLCCIFMYRSSF